MTTKAPTCRSCGRDLRPHWAQPNTSQPEARCGWWRCSNRICGVDLYAFARGIRLLTNGTVERITRPA